VKLSDDERDLFYTVSRLLERGDHPKELVERFAALWNHVQLEPDAEQVKVLPAQPGWYVLEPEYNLPFKAAIDRTPRRPRLPDEPFVSFRRGPVMAWAINVHPDDVVENGGFATPIGIHEHVEGWAVTGPDGEVHGATGRWQSVADWLAWLNRTENPRL
jgi:hypothetical protein